MTLAADVRSGGEGKRVVSLVPSVTETLCHWGVEPVGVTRFCERPDLLAVGGTKNPDLAAIERLDPDLVVVDIEENRREDAEALRSAGIEVHVLHITSIDDVAPATQSLAAAVGVESTLAAQLSAMNDTPAAAALPVWVPIWRRPWMTIATATYGASVLAAAGFEVRGPRPVEGDRYPRTTLEEAALAEPRWVLAPSEPYHFTERHRRELEVVAPVVMVDGRDLLWWGTRTPGAVIRLRELAANLWTLGGGGKIGGTIGRDV